MIYSPSNWPEPLPREGLASASLKRAKHGVGGSGPRLTQSARARLGVVRAPLLSFADSQDTLTDVLSSVSLTRSVAVAPLPSSARTALHVRSVAPPARPVQPREKAGQPGRAAVQLDLYSNTPVHRGVVLGSFGR
jgi:hypothetical protein